jgi:hypothetical protein
MLEIQLVPKPRPDAETTMKKRGVRSRATGSGQGRNDTRTIKIDLIEWPVLLRPIDPSHVVRLGGAAKLPSIKVWEVEPNRYRGIDGYHRWHLALERGDASVVATTYHFPENADGERAFELECLRSNLHHGLPLTQNQRDQAIVRFWRRWGRTGAREHGETLDSLGRVFNLTKQRIHQIVSTADRQAALADASEVEAARSRQAHPGGFSDYGRFSAATQRLANLLGDAGFMNQLFRDRKDTAFAALRALRTVIDQIVGDHE